MVGTMKNKPAKCCCGCKCLIDSFTDAVEVTDADVETIRSANHPQSPYPSWLRAEIELDAGSIARLYLVWDDSDPGDGLYVEVTPQNGDTLGTLKLFRKDGTQLGSTLDLICALPNPDGDTATDLWHRVTICYDPDTDEIKVIFDAADSRGWIVQNQEITAAIPSGFAAGRKAGYGTGSGHTGTISFRNYRYERLWYCEEGNGCTGDCDGDGYSDPPARTVCRNCRESCFVIDEDFTGLEDGDMPCSWNADGTDWGIVDERATGNGEICHRFDTTSGSYHVSATFAMGHLETQGDFVTVLLRYGDVFHSLKITRVAGYLGGDPDRYYLEWTPTTFGTGYVAQLPETITLTICPYAICNSYGLPPKVAVVTPGPVCVSIIQPTLSGHIDASLTEITLIKDHSMDPQCASCGCNYLCSDCAESLPFFLYVDFGAPFLLPQFGCDTCEELQGVFELVRNTGVTTSCVWLYVNTGCPCNFNPTFILYTAIRIWVSLESGGIRYYVGVQLLRYIADPSNASECKGPSFAYASEVFPTCTSAESPITLTLVSAPDPGFGHDGDSVGSKVECYGTVPSTILMAFAEADL